MNNFDNMIAMSSMFSNLNAQNMMNPFGGLAAQNLSPNMPNAFNPIEAFANQKHPFQSFQFSAFQ